MTSSDSCWRRQRLRKCDGDGALLGVVLADDETVDFGDDLTRAENGRGHSRSYALDHDVVRLL